MKQQEVKDVIIDLLEEIVNRTKYINHHHPGKDMSLDIDLVKDDLRLLYRKFEALKKLAEEPPKYGHVVDKPGSVQQVPPHQQQQPPHQEQQLSHQEQQPPEPEQKLPHQEQQLPHQEQQPPEPEQKLPHQEQQLTQQIQTEEEPATASGDHDADQEVREREEARRRFFEPAPIIHPPEKKAETDDSLLPEPGAESQDTEDSGPDKVSGQAVSETEPQRPDATTGEDDNTNMEPKTVKVTTSAAQEEPPAKVKASEHIDSDGNNSKPKTVLDLLSAYGKKTIGDQYAGEDNSVHQRIAGNREDKSIGARMQQNPISSIKEVIGVNEKFLFINELFDGNIQVYYDAIARLNDFDNMQAAFDYLNELGAQYAWDAGRSTDTIEKLASYVQRRYM